MFQVFRKIFVDLAKTVWLTIFCGWEVRFRRDISRTGEAPIRDTRNLQDTDAKRERDRALEAQKATREAQDGLKPARPRTRGERRSRHVSLARLRRIASLPEFEGELEVIAAFNDETMKRRVRAAKKS